jgi:flagellar protein FliO/FliZ
MNVLKWLWVIIALGSIIFMSYVATRYIGSKTGKIMRGKYINIIETVSLGIDKQLHLVRVEEQFVLIASSGKNIEFLTTIKIDKFATDEPQGNSNVFDFKNIFDKYLQSLKNKKDNKINEKERNNTEEEPVDGDVFKNNLNKLRAITMRKDRQGEENGDEITYEK